MRIRVPLRIGDEYVGESSQKLAKGCHAGYSSVSSMRLLCGLNAIVVCEDQRNLVDSMPIAKNRMTLVDDVVEGLGEVRDSSIHQL